MLRSPDSDPAIPAIDSAAGEYGLLIDVMPQIGNISADVFLIPSIHRSAQ